jgi:hypothetical protein
MVTVGNHNYMGQWHPSQIVEVNGDGSFNQLIVDGLPDTPLGMAANPANGHIFVNAANLGDATSQILDLDPIARAWKPFVNTGLVDGLTVSADGRTLYAARRTDGDVVGFSTSTGEQVFDSGSISLGIDGITVGTGLFTQEMIVNTNEGTVVEVDMQTAQQTIIADGGSRGDFAHASYRDGSFFITQTEEVDRLSFPPVSLRVDVPAKIFTGTPFDLTVTALDGNGNTVTSYTGTMDFTSSDKQAVLPGQYTFISSDEGSHTFSITLKSPGTQTVSAIDAANESIAGDVSTTVKPGPTHLRIDSVGQTVAGAPFSITVTALDTDDNTVTDYSGTVRFSSSDAQHILPAEYTFVSSDQGSHTFGSEVTLKNAGSQWIDAVDRDNGLLEGRTAVTVSPAAADHFRFDVHFEAVAGSAFPITVTVEDPYNNTATGYTGTVTFTSSDAQAALPTDYPFAAADAGVHVFNVTLKTAGPQSVTATDTVTPGISRTLAGIETSPAAPSQLAVTGYPIPTVAGARHRFTVTIEDPYGNLVPTYVGTVSLRASDRRAVLPVKRYIFRAIDGGTHSFLAAFETAGIQSLTASASNLASAPETGILVLGGAARKLLLSGLPKSCIAGQTVSVTVTLRDVFGNVANIYAGTVHFTSSDPRAVLPAAYRFTSDDAGRHTFAVIFESANPQKLVVADKASPSLKAQQAGIQVRPAALASFQIIVPFTAMVGHAFSFTIIARDAYGNIATSYRGAVHFTSSDTQALLPADFTFRPAAHGRQTFKAKFESFGRQTLTVSDKEDDTLMGTSRPVLVIG